MKDESPNVLLRNMTTCKALDCKLTASRGIHIYIIQYKLKLHLLRAVLGHKLQEQQGFVDMPPALAYVL